jgi:hypothetical protein
MTVIAVGTWARDEDNPVYPVGANPKRLLLCPAQPPHAELIAGHGIVPATVELGKEALPTLSR